MGGETNKNGHENASQEVVNNTVVNTEIASNKITLQRGSDDSNRTLGFQREGRENSKPPLHVLFATFEVAPFSKMGGLGDVSRALPAALMEMGVRVTVMTPWYTSLPERAPWLADMETLAEGWLMLGHNLLPVLYKTPKHPPPGPRLIFVEEPVYLSHRSPYSTHRLEEKGVVEPEGSILFSKAVASWVARHPESGMVVHLNDHQTAATALMLKSIPHRPPVVLTVHNFAYHGVYDPGCLSLLGDQEGWYPGGPLEFYGKVNLLKAGISHADAVTTVSPTYLKQVIHQSDFSMGLDGVLQARRDRLEGILNGAETEVWNPRQNPYLEATYSADTWQEGKAANKAALLAELGMDPGLKGGPLLVMTARLVDQKGIDLLEAVTPRLVKSGAGLVVMGQGDLHHEDRVAMLAKAFPGRVKAVLHYTERMAHRLNAAADIFLMPSRFEPCGLTQMYAMGFGAVPVVHCTGGLADTVSDAGNQHPEGTGFCFATPDPESFWGALERAMAAWHRPAAWAALVERGMGQDFSWRVSAERYLTLYQRVLSGDWPPRAVLPDPQMSVAAAGVGLEAKTDKAAKTTKPARASKIPAGIPAVAGSAKNRKKAKPSADIPQVVPAALAGSS
ncbi:MAG: glycogen synthase [Deltaproteobacteria bacterium]|nr:glycogen synthase [Deltaproteobacteria bacterium]